MKISIGELASKLRPMGYNIFRNKEFPDYFGQFDFTAPTIVDIGVGTGTPYLYHTFPDRKFILVDPMPPVTRVRDMLTEVLDHSFEFHECVLGPEAGEVTFYYCSEHPNMSGLMKRTDLPDLRYEPVTKNMLALDTLMATNGYAAPFGLKIDTEGYELQVLGGGISTLKQSEFVILECSVRQRFERDYSFADLIAFMQRQGFVVYDILQTPLGPPKNLEILFLKNGDQRILEFESGPRPSADI